MGYYCYKEKTNSLIKENAALKTALLKAIMHSHGWNFCSGEWKKI